MSAISAFVSLASAISPRQAAEASLAAQAEYGPDGTQLWANEQVSLGRALMCLVPEDRFDTQPGWSRDRSTCLVGDVRLDNREELIAELELQGVAELSDATVLMAAWQRWNTDCLKHILGGFAFAVWTPATRELFAARDHVGESPLFYHRSAGFFALASMPVGLRALPGVGRELNQTWIAEWLVSSLQTGTETLYRGIERLLPGHFLRVTPDRFQTAAYWAPSDAKPIRFKRNEEYAEGLVEVLDRATRGMLRRIGGVGSQLSSGLDSSSVTASTAIELARRGEGLYAYTSVPQAGFSEESYSKRPVKDEGPFAAEVAAMYPNVTHVKIDVAGLPTMETIDEFSRLLNQPYLNGFNALWARRILEHARTHGVGLMMQGVYGNATISFEAPTSLGELLRTGKLGLLARHMHVLRQNGEYSYRNSFKAALEGVAPTRANWVFWRPPITFDRGESLIRAEFASEQQLQRKAVEQHPPPSRRYWAMRDEFHIRGDYGVINAAYRAYGHCDFRDPTGDKRMWEYCYGIPWEQFVIDGHSRSLVRRAMRGRLPDATLDRYRQGRQGADWYLNMRQDLPNMRAAVEAMEQTPLAQHILDVPAMKDLLDHFPETGYGTIHVMNRWKYSLSRALSLGSMLVKENSAARANPA